MQPDKLAPITSIGVCAVIMTILIILMIRKALDKKNNAIRAVTGAFVFYTFSIITVFVSNFLEYILEILGSVPSWYYFPLRQILQYADLQNALLLIGNIFIYIFYNEVFSIEKKTMNRVIYIIYAIFSVLFALMFIFVTYLDISNPLRNFLDPIISTDFYYIIIIIQSLVVHIPLMVTSLKLRKKLKEEEPNSIMAKRLLYIFLMSISFIGVFVFALLDALNDIDFSFWVYFAYGMIVLSELFMYFGYIRKE